MASIARISMPAFTMLFHSGELPDFKYLVAKPFCS